MKLIIQANGVLEKLQSRPSFLMVGTIEPRKGYEQVLGGFEALWDEGIDVNLVIVGKEGWMVDGLVKKIRLHSEYNRRLHWLEGISDEYLERIYSICACLISASEDEGFGLPLIEAAQHQIPIIARDIPVFVEVVGEHAYYFSGTEAGALSERIRDWIFLYNKNQHPKSNEIPWLTWNTSAKDLTDGIIKMHGM